MTEEEVIAFETLGDESRLAQALCRACLNVKYALRKGCSIAYSGAACIEVVEAAKKILLRDEERERKNLADEGDMRHFYRRPGELYTAL